MTEAVSWTVMAAGCYVILIAVMLQRYRYGYLQLLGASSLLLFGGTNGLLVEAQGGAGPLTAILVCLMMPWWTYNLAIASRLMVGRPVIGWRGYVLAIVALVAYAVVAGSQTEYPDLARAPGALAVVFGQVMVGVTLLGHARQTRTIGSWLISTTSLGEGALMLTYPLSFHFDSVLVVGNLASGALILLQGVGVALFTHERAQSELHQLTDALTAELARQVSDLERVSVLAEMGQTAAAVAHEVKNQLNVIGLGISLLARELPETGRIAAGEARVRQGLQDTAQLLRGLLAIGRFGPPRPETVDLIPLIDAQLSTPPDSPRPTLSFTVPSGPVITDPQWLGRILRELVEASPDLMPQGGTLTVAQTGLPIVTLHLPPPIDPKSAGKSLQSDDPANHPGLLLARILMTGLGGSLAMDVEGTGGVAIVLDLADPVADGHLASLPEPAV